VTFQTEDAAKLSRVAIAYRARITNYAHHPRCVKPAPGPVERVPGRLP
jgi:hypothetical protein